MRMSKTLFVTLKEEPADAEVRSHALMVRAGFIQQIAAGVYVYGPLMWRVLRKIEAIIREEHDKAGCQELLIRVATNCDDTRDLTCVLNMCGPELDAAGGPTGEGTVAAQAMGPCLTPLLECPEAGSACEACVNSFGMGGAGQGGMCP